MVKSKLYILANLLELIDDQHMSPEYFESNERNFKWHEKPWQKHRKKSNYTPPKKKRKK